MLKDVPRHAAITVVVVQPGAGFAPGITRQTIPTNKRIPWNALRTVIRFRARTELAGRVAFPFDLSAVITNPPLHTDTLTLRVPVCVLHADDAVCRELALTRLAYKVALPPPHIALVTCPPVLAHAVVPGIDFRISYTAHTILSGRTDTLGAFSIT
jgi:hypothetical protein